MSRFKFAHEDENLPAIMSSYGWDFEDTRAGDIVKNGDPSSRVGITGPHGRWFAQHKGRWLKRRYFTTPSAAIMAVEECS